MDYLGSDLSDEDDEYDFNNKGEEHSDDEDIESPIPTCDSEVKLAGSNPNVKDRSIYVHPVLNLVENLTQWKSSESQKNTNIRTQKDNYTPISTEPSFKENDQYFSLKLEINQLKKSN